MLSDLDRKVGVVLFINTSMSDAESKVITSLLEDLWRHAANFPQAKIGQ